MQQSPQMFPVVQSIPPPTNITTEQIQKCLDENKKLIVAIMENQNLGKLAECAQYQAILQKNLQYLAAIADTQPPPPTPTSGAAPAMASQMTTPQPVNVMQPPPPSYFMQYPQASPAGIFPPRGPLQFSSPHQLQDPMQGHMGIRPMSINNNNTMQYPMQQPQSSHVGVKGSKPEGADDGND